MFNRCPKFRKSIRTPHRELHALLFSKWVGSLTSYTNTVRRDLRFIVLIREDYKVYSNHLQMSFQRQHLFLSYLKTLSVGLGIWTRDLPCGCPLLHQKSHPVVNVASVTHDPVKICKAAWLQSYVKANEN